MANNIKILVIDDEVISLQTTKAILKRKDYIIFSNTTAKGIFETIENCAPDLILMDHDMPDISGGDAIRQIKANDTYKSIPIILFSSRHDLEELARKAGADAYLAKGIKKYDELDIIIQGFTKLPD